MGQEAGRDWEQGIPMWSDKTDNRKIYFLGERYLGANGLYDQGKFSMVSYVTGQVYTNSTLNFSGNDATLLAPQQAEPIIQSLNNLQDLQYWWRQQSGHRQAVP